MYNRHTTDKQPTEAVGVSQDDKQGGTESSSSMNTPTLSSDKRALETVSTSRKKHQQTVISSADGVKGLSEPILSDTASDVSKPQIPDNGGKESLNAEPILAIRKHQRPYYRKMNLLSRALSSPTLSL